MSITNHSNPTTAKHQLVSPEGFLRPVEVPEGVVTKLVIYVGGSRAKLEEVLGVCKRINSVKPCMDLSTLQSILKYTLFELKYLVFNYREGRTFTYIAEDKVYQKVTQKEEYYEVSYNLFIEKLKWAERALLLERRVEELGSVWV